MKSKRKKTQVRSLGCRCGYTFTAIFPSGVVKRTVTCHSCGRKIKTSGKQEKDKNCGGCGRKLHHAAKECKFCGVKR